jgi:hypothetical protein
LILNYNNILNESKKGNHNNEYYRIPNQPPDMKNKSLATIITTKQALTPFAAIYDRRFPFPFLVPYL